MFDHKILAFQKRIEDLADQPMLSANALKRWFDSSPEELRVALNHVCDDGKKLEDKVEAMILETFSGAISRNMFDEALKEELDSKATTENLNEVQTNLAAADVAIEKKRSDMIVLGTFKGDGQEKQVVELGFTPRAILITLANGHVNDGNIVYGGLIFPNIPGDVNTIVENGFTASGTRSTALGNYPNYTYKYVALR